MSFVLREIVGWLLVVLGLLGLYVCFGLIQERRIIEVGPMSIIAVIVFRGGIHLLKVAVAARMCVMAKEKTRPAGPTARPVVRPVLRTLPGSPPQAVPVATPARPGGS